MAIESIKPLRGGDDTSRLDGMLESLLELCMNEGAHAFEVIACRDLSFVERPAAMQDVPDGERSIFWPVPRFPRDSIEDALGLYRKAVVFAVRAGAAQSRIDAMRTIYDIASRVESACFYGGYYLAIGLAAGNCKEVFCAEEKKCQALTVGKACLHPLRSRPSLEACGLDPAAIAAEVGWDDYEPGAFLIGMVFVG
ncbi:MAG: hypothetical protein JW854_00880 [Actinobacteria bacterium]|nr:hypothetical protein [Actinomycetota bacterium]